ncbi:MAG: NAD(P)H-dependent oxidoreductase subunit E [Myxococcales bacterium]|nr:NAD(P)H-dependent oxidoreductase subunit E [Myxococcales bacterium]
MSNERKFSPETEAQFQKLLTRYPTRLAALIPTLWLGQEEFGHLDRTALAYVAERLELPMSQVVNTCTFYTMFTPVARGKFHIELCTNVACWLRGCREIQQVVEDELGLKHKQTSADGMFTYEEVECLAACDKAPMCQVNGADTYNLTPESFRELIRGLKSKG